MKKIATKKTFSSLNEAGTKWNQMMRTDEPIAEHQLIHIYKVDLLVRRASLILVFDKEIRYDEVQQSGSCPFITRRIFGGAGQYVRRWVDAMEITKTRKF